MMIFRPKSKYTYAKSGERYPRQVEEIDIPLWSMEDTEDFIRYRFNMIEEALDLPDDMIDPCTPEERWEDESKYAVIKIGASRASKVFSDLSEAEEYKNTLKDKSSFIIEHRSGVARKCSEYCPVSCFCNHAIHETAYDLKDII